MIALLLAAAGCARGGDQPASDTLAAQPAEAGEDGSCSYADSTWTCPLGRGVALRAVARYDSAQSTILLRNIETAPASGAIQRQVLTIEDPMGPLEPHDVTVVDMDGDGYGDLRVARQFGHPNNSGNYTWRYDPARRGLVYDSLLSTETNVSPDSTGCVSTQGWLGGNDTVESRYCLQKGEWVEVWLKRIMTDTNGVQLEREYRLQGDSLRLVRSDTVRG